MEAAAIESEETFPKVLEFLLFWLVVQVEQMVAGLAFLAVYWNVGVALRTNFFASLAPFLVSHDLFGLCLWHDNMFSSCISHINKLSQCFNISLLDLACKLFVRLRFRSISQSRKLLIRYLTYKYDAVKRNAGIPKTLTIRTRLRLSMDKSTIRIKATRFEWP